MDANPVIPAPPPGFVVQDNSVPPPPAGFVLQDGGVTPGAMSAVPPQSSSPQDLAQLTGGIVSRPTMEAVGGIGGSVVSSPSGPAGVIVGGALGAALGSAAYDSVDSFMRALGALPQKKVDALTQLKQQSENAYRAGVTDAYFGAGGAAIGTAFRAITPMIGSVLGVRTPEVAQIIQDAKNAGLVLPGGTPALGAMDVAGGVRGKALRGYQAVTSMFPLLRGPMQKAATAKASAVVDVVNHTLNTMAPNATMADELGVDMTKAARNSFGQFRLTAAQLYDNFRNIARSAGAIVPTAPLKAAAKEAMLTADKQRIVLRAPEPPPSRIGFPGSGETPPPTVIEGAAADQLNALLSRWSRLPDKLTVDQMQGQADFLKELVDKASADGFDVSRYMDFKKGIEEALGSIDTTGLNGELASKLVSAKKAADSFYSQGIAKFQTPTAKQFGRVDKNVFKVGPLKPGSLNEDTIAQAAINLKSPQAIRDLTALVGKENMGRAARLHFDQAWTNSLNFKDGEIASMDWAKLRQTLGLGTKGMSGIGASAQEQAIREFLAQSGVDMSKLTSLIDTASKIQIPSEINKMLARRTSLGGMRSAISAVTMANVIRGGWIHAFGVGLMMRYMGKIISSPQQLEAMRRVIAPTGSEFMKRKLLGTLAKELLAPAQTGPMSPAPQ